MMQDWPDYLLTLHRNEIIGVFDYCTDYFKNENKKAVLQDAVIRLMIIKK